MVALRSPFKNKTSCVGFISFTAESSNRYLISLFMKKSDINFIFFYYWYIYNCNFYLWYSFTSMVPTLYLKIQHIYFYAIKSCISLDIHVTFPYLILSSNEPVQNYINFHECFKRIYLTNKIIFLVVIGDLK